MPPIERSFPAETLKAFRAWLGLSQEDVATIVGISARSVQAYETEGGPPWLPYALMGWAVMFHGVTARVAARRLGLPHAHYPVSDEDAEADDLDAFDGAPLAEAGVDGGADADDEFEDAVEPADAPGSPDDVDALIARRGRLR